MEWISDLQYLVHTKTVPKVKGKLLCTPIILKKSIKTGFWIRYIFFEFLLWIFELDTIFTVQKQALIGLLKVIVIQN